MAGSDRVYLQPFASQITQWPQASCPIIDPRFEGSLDLEVSFSEEKSPIYANAVTFDRSIKVISVAPLRMLAY